MGDSHDEDEERTFEDFVDHTVVVDTHAPQAEKITLQHASPQRTLSKVVNRTHDPAAVSFRNAREGPDGAPLDPNRVAHP